MMTYFRSPIAYFLISVFLIGTGYFFLYNVFLTSTATMNETLKNMGILLITLTPVLTMRIFSGEYSGKTMELLSTLPLKTWQIVLGKYLGAISILFLMTLTSCINLIPIYLYGNPYTSDIISGYMGFFLLGMACIAIGQLFSALTHNQIVAALVTLPVLMGFWFIGYMQNMQSNVFMQNLLGYLSFSFHYGDFIRGLLRSEAVTYYLLVIATALILNTSYLKWRR